VKLFVTGGAGFIGSNFTRLVLNNALPGLENAEVTVFDALTYSGTLSNLESVAGSERFSFVEGDIRGTAAVSAALPGHDAIVHFAAESHVDRSVTDSRIFVDTNVLGDTNSAGCCSETWYPPFVHVSTDEVYGSIEEGSWNEEQPLLPNSPTRRARQRATFWSVATS